MNVDDVKRLTKNLKAFDISKNANMLSVCYIQDKLVAHNVSVGDAARAALAVKLTISDPIPSSKEMKDLYLLLDEVASLMINVTSGLVGGPKSSDDFGKVLVQYANQISIEV